MGDSGNGNDTPGILFRTHSPVRLPLSFRGALATMPFCSHRRPPRRCTAFFSSDSSKSPQTLSLMLLLLIHTLIGWDGAGWPTLDLNLNIGSRTREQPEDGRHRFDCSQFEPLVLLRRRLSPALPASSSTGGLPVKAGQFNERGAGLHQSLFFPPSLSRSPGRSTHGRMGLARTGFVLLLVCCSPRCRSPFVLTRFDVPCRRHPDIRRVC